MSFLSGSYLIFGVSVLPARSTLNATPFKPGFLFAFSADNICLSESYVFPAAES
jgi:hypothetical protein